MKIYQTTEGYLVTRYKGRSVKYHRLVWFQHYGEWPKGKIDHINGVRNDNRIENLRVVDNSEHVKNKGKGKNNTSGVVGVIWDKSCGKWTAQIQVDGKNHTLKRSKNFFEAVCARKSAEIKFGFHPNHGSVRPVSYA